MAFAQQPQPQKPMQWPLYVLAVFVGVMAGRLFIDYKNRSNVWAPNAKPRKIEPRGDLAADEKSTIDLFHNSSPSVVYITTTALQRDFFSTNVFEIPRGSGSGFMWNKKGHIVTNYHVIENASSARVTLADQSTWDATLVGAEPDKDLAVLKIIAPFDRLHPIPIGTSNDLQVGQKVFAIGNPFGLDQTLTTGIISGLEREIKSQGKRPIKGVIQTDAAINPGNSGGPLLDSAGRLIGVNTAIYSPSGAYAGVGFAVPVDTVNRIVPQLVAKGKITRPGFGITIVPDTFLQQRGLKGVLVREVLPNSAAAKSGLRPTSVDPDGQINFGDIIVEVNGKKVENSEELFSVLEACKVGDQCKVKVQRGRNSFIELTVTLQELN